ncbi:MAG: hypothetical protein KME15_20435 [Drouetiella hepatica Uher 2000/2452]|jgi:hypothetical protein|uniref:Uncharacterized protein n=1 Tax=Drouetiella hepatica Uher 2000/2452 TaxID=904376 RepID=A0A951QFS6_9CYAN|nr:hypothetical protein [Drouetiella hepatica Uher 2000/2452]
MRTSKASQAAEREAIASRIVEIRGSGDVLQGCRLDMKYPGGTASRAAKVTRKYAQLSSGRGNLLPNGRKSQYVALDDIPKMQMAIVRGNEITRLSKRLRQLEAIGG